MSKYNLTYLLLSDKDESDQRDLRLRSCNEINKHDSDSCDERRG